MCDMFTPTPPSLLPDPLVLPVAIQSFLAGILVALGFLSALAHRTLSDSPFRKAGLFGLMAAATWISFSDIAASLLHAWLVPATHPVSLVLAGATLIVWERLTADLLAASAPAQSMALGRRLTALGAGMISLAALVPWEPSYRLSTFLFGLLVALLAILTLQAGLRAHRDGLGSAKAVVVAGLAQLVCVATLGAVFAGWISRATSMAVLQFAILTFALALGWVTLSRLKDLRRATEAAQTDQLAAANRHALELESLVQMRNAELSARLSDLGDARRAAELANDGLQRALDELEQAAATDRLTGAWNRRRFEEAVLAELALAQRRRDPLSLVMFDLDHFKRVNDTHGHGAGDAVLVGLVQCVRKHLRASDSIIRWGGEEFLVMIPATHLEGALALAEKMRGAVAAIEFPGIGQVTMSLGVAQYAPGESLSAWIERADQALYGAKAAGRNCTQAAPMPERTAGALTGRTLLEVVWDETYESGNALIDKQHQRLFHLANSLMAVLTEETPMAEVSLRLESLLAHAAQHFHDEEALLRVAHYPDLAHHGTVHAGLLTRARQLQKEVRAGQLDLGKLVAFLAVDLIKGHLLTEDQNYFEHLRSVSSDAPSA